MENSEAAYNNNYEMIDSICKHIEMIPPEKTSAIFAGIIEMIVNTFPSEISIPILCGIAGILQILENIPLNSSNELQMTYIDAAFRSQCPNQVFFFIGHEYVVVQYDPSAPGRDFVVKPRRNIIDCFPSLRRFQAYGVDAAFSCHDIYRAYLFQGHSCALVEYEYDDIPKGKVIKFNLTSRIFPGLKGTDFEHFVDAAFESTITGQAYLFFQAQYCLLNYVDGSLLDTGAIIDVFPCLENTMFQSGIGAAFASHTPNEAYLFKDNNYVRIYFSPGEPSKSYIIERPSLIFPLHWPLNSILPFQVGLDLKGIRDWEDKYLTASEDEYLTTSDDEDGLK